MIIFIELHLVDAPVAGVQDAGFVDFLHALATYSEGMSGREIIFSWEYRDFISMCDQEVLLGLVLVCFAAAVGRMWWWVIVGEGIDEFDVRYSFIVLYFELLYEFAHSEIPDVDEAVVAGAGEDFLTEFVDWSDLIVVNVFKEQNWLDLSRVPNTDASVEPTRNKQIFVIQRTKVVYTGVFKLISSQRRRWRKCRLAVFRWSSTYAQPRELV